MALVQIGRFLYPPTQLPEYNTDFTIVEFDTVANCFVVTDQTTDPATTTSVGQVQLPVVVAALAQADLATGTYIAYPIGKMLMVTAYAGTADGVTFVKNSLAGSNFNDWRVVATTNKATTGTIGAVPA